MFDNTGYEVALSQHKLPIIEAKVCLKNDKYCHITETKNEFIAEKENLDM